MTAPRVLASLLSRESRGEGAEEEGSEEGGGDRTSRWLRRRQSGVEEGREEKEEKEETKVEKRKSVRKRRSSRPLQETRELSEGGEGKTRSSRLT